MGRRPFDFLPSCTKTFAYAFIAFIASSALAGDLPPIQTVFIIMMENKTWGEIRNNTNAPYINNVLVPMASHCENYNNLPNIHPSLPNYLWLEAGTNFGIVDDNDPTYDHMNVTNHLVTLLQNAGISWRSYMEHVYTNVLPLSTCCGWSSRHNPFLYFDDVTCTNDIHCPYGLAHIRPYSELAADLTNNTVARYNFITPDECNDMHTACWGDLVLQGDTWLAAEIPRILNSPAFTNGGAVFIAFDETDAADTRIPLLLLSPFARGGGYASTLPYNHSSLLRTVQDIFNVRPYLGDAANATNLSDLFTPNSGPASTNFQISAIRNVAPGAFQLTVSGVLTNTPLILETSTDLLSWNSLCTNSSSTSTVTVFTTNSPPNVLIPRFYRVHQQIP